MAKTRNETDETTTVETGVQSEPKATNTPKEKAASVFTSDELAKSKEFKDRKWLIYATVGAGEKVTKAEARKRIEAYLKKNI